MYKVNTALQRGRKRGNGVMNRPSKVAKYAEAVALLAEMKKQNYNVVRKAADETGLNYDSLRKYVYTYRRELIGLDSERNRDNVNPNYAARYAKAIALLASEPSRPKNMILYVADKLGLNYHALRAYIYVHHPGLAQKRKTGK